MSRLKEILALVSVSAVLGTASAGPIPATPAVPPGGASVGESLLTSFAVGAQSALNVDWMVLDVTASFGFSAYAYLYQLENTTAVNIDVFTVTMQAGAIATIFQSGSLNDDLDVAGPGHPAHDVAAFPALAGEADPFGLQQLTSVLTTLNPQDNTVTWAFDPLQTTCESTLLYFISRMPPTYNLAVAHDGTPPSPWGSAAPGGQPVPVPVPEPSSIAAVASGVVALAALRRRR